MILLTHIDLDGAGCAIVAQHFYAQKLTKIYHCDYDQVDSTLLGLLKKTNEFIVLADISMNAETAALVNQAYANRIELFDHHQTAWEYLRNYTWAKFKLDRCGASVLFESLKEQMPEVPIFENLSKLIFHVNDYDLWLHTSPESSLFNDMLYLLGMDTFVGVMKTRIQESQPLIRDTDQLYLNGLQSKKYSYFKQCVEQAIVQGNRLVVLSSRHTSELCQYIRDISSAPEAWKTLEYIDVINLETRTHSLRSYKPDYDVSQIAKQHGGGGHKNAAGYQIATRLDSFLLTC